MIPKRPFRPGAAFFQALAERVAAREPLVLCTVGASSGSAPGKAGAKMLVTHEGQVGTVGGGKLERAVLTRARAILAECGPLGMPGPRSESYDVTQDLGMSCGGTMTVWFEPVIPPPRLVLFGAGHVAAELCALANRAGFDVWVCDDRADWLTPQRFPDARQRILAPVEEAVARAGIAADTFVASATPGHAMDEQVVLHVLRSGAAPRYFGVIGSRRKAVELRRSLVDQGLPPATIETLRIPMGIDIGAAEPREIAVSIVAEMIAVLRGVGSERRRW
jgi:xanthine dehydrogenase accessory factor